MALKTDREIAALKVGEGKTREVFAVASPAGGGLCIEVRANGGKTWLYRYRINGRARKQTLGAYPAMRLAAARTEHTKALALFQAGSDPALTAKAEKMKRQTMPTFGELFEEWMEWKAKAKPARESTMSAYRFAFRSYLNALGSTPVNALTRAAIFTQLSKVRVKSIQGARKALTICAQSLDLAVNSGLIELNPARTITPSTIGAEATPPRQRWLSREELVAFWHALDNDTRIHPTHANILRLIVLTGARRGEVMKAKWSDITGDKWVIPADNTKNGRSHTVTLCPLALEILDKQRLISGGTDWIFEGIRNRGSLQVADGNALRQVIERVRTIHMEQSEPFTPHDLRRTFATGCAEYLDANERTIELALNHKSRNALVETYQAGRRAEQVAALFQRWGEFVRVLVQPAEQATGNVIAVNFGGAK